MKEAIKKAIEGGWKPVEKNWTGRWSYTKETNMFNYWVDGNELAYSRWMEAIWGYAPFWQALGKSLGWGKTKSGRETFAGKNWKREWHRFIDHLAEGKDPEDFFKELLTK